MHRRAFLTASAAGGVALVFFRGDVSAQTADTKLICVDGTSGADVGNGSLQAPMKSLTAAISALLGTSASPPSDAGVGAVAQPFSAHLSFGATCWLTVAGVNAGAKVDVVDVAQQVVLSGIAEKDTLVLSASGLKPGFYVVRSGPDSVRIVVTQ